MGKQVARHACKDSVVEKSMLLEKFDVIVNQFVSVNKKVEYAEHPLLTGFQSLMLIIRELLSY